MSEIAIPRRSVDQHHWYGMLCAENFDAVAERMRRMLEGRWYTFVSANSYREDSGEFRDYDVHTGNRLTVPMRLNTYEGGHRRMSFADQSYCWGLQTAASTEQDAREGSIYDRVKLAFNDHRNRGESVTIDHYAPAGYRLLWTVVVEDHDSELERIHV